ncbi:hypothetical protein ARAF_0779 [Arsenophonus endosymbiont of Aleurodicus floccissimus]|nr:hypothetical protein ARAF_0779 [Arsenophonus endosymbiont of Aleurodicus floccissimus]
MPLIAILFESAAPPYTGTSTGAKTVVGGDKRIIGIMDGERVNRYHLAVFAIRRVKYASRP